MARNGHSNGNDTSHRGSTHSDGSTCRYKWLKANTETAAFYDVTKEMADDIMEYHNKINRNLSISRADRLGRDRARDRWYTSHQGAGFDWNGQAIDGQHRFTMISRTELTTRILMVTGLDPRVREVTDIGSKRSPADVLQINGREDANVRTVAIVRQMMNGTRKGATVAEIIDAYDIYHQAAIEAQSLFSRQNVRNITIAPVMGVLARASFTEDMSKLEEFAEILISGKGGKGRAGDRSVVLLHKFLSALPHRGGGMSPIIYGYVETVLAAFLENVALSELTMPEEELFVLPERPTKKAKAKIKIVHPMRGLAKTA